MKIFKKCSIEPYSFLVNDTTSPSDNPLLMIKLGMKNYSMILIEKLQKYQPYHQAKLISMNIL